MYRLRLELCHTRRTVGGLESETRMPCQTWTFPAFFFFVKSCVCSDLDGSISGPTNGVLRASVFCWYCVWDQRINPTKTEERSIWYSVARSGICSVRAYESDRSWLRSFNSTFEGGVLYRVWVGLASREFVHHKHIYSISWSRTYLCFVAGKALCLSALCTLRHKNADDLLWSLQLFICFCSGNAVCKVLTFSCIESYQNKIEWFRH